MEVFMTMTVRDWNDKLKKLRTVILDEREIRKTRELVLELHRMVHPSEMTDAGGPTFEDELWSAMSAEDFTRIPGNGAYPIAWHLWHSARIEDITVSFLLTGTPQVFTEKPFAKNLGAGFKDTGNSMTGEEVARFLAGIEMGALRKYRTAVGRKTRLLLEGLTIDFLKTRVSARDLDRVREAGAVVPDSQWLLEFWGRKTFAGIILMPLTRHLSVHINQSRRLVKKGGKPTQ
jgi:hypothetical protein